MTPSLCEAFHEVLRDEAAKIDPISLSSGVGLPDSTDALANVWHQLTTIKWLTGAHCDLSGTLTDIETKLRTVTPGPPWGYRHQITDTLNTLATLRQTH